MSLDFGIDTDQNCWNSCPRLVVFYFSASWCQPCHLMAPKYAELANMPVAWLTEYELKLSLTYTS